MMRRALTLERRSVYSNIGAIAVMIRIIDNSPRFDLSIIKEEEDEDRLQT